MSVPPLLAVPPSRRSSRPGSGPGSGPAAGRASGPAPPLLVSADPALRDAVGRLAAAAGCVPSTVADPRAALLPWSRAPLVLVGADLARKVADLAPPRRDDVLVVGWGPVPDDLFRDAVGLGASRVVGLPEGEAWLGEVLADGADPTSGRGLVVAVLGGSGGAGATTTACALAEVAARRGPAVLVDLDPLGPGVDRVVGLDDPDGAAGVRWDALESSTGRLSSRSLATALPQVRGLSVLAWPVHGRAAPGPAAVREVLRAATRCSGLVVVDLPRAVDPVVEEVVARGDHLLVVCRASVAGVAGAARTCARLPAGAPVGLVVVGRGDPAALERVVGHPVVATVPWRRGLDEQVDLGLGPVRGGRGPVSRAAEALLAEVGAGAVPA